MADVILIIVAVAALAWIAVLVASSVRGTDEEVSPNLSPFISNEELETVRMERVLGFAVVLAGFLAVSLPLYFLTETNRQAAFEETFAEESIERGAALFEDPAGCAQCHGSGGVGGVAAFFDPRSGVPVQWAAPSLNDVLYRYDRDETRFWIVYGRAGAPMPAWGLEGGGAFNDQEVDDLVNYIESIQLPQNEVLAKTATNVAAAQTALDNADASMDGVIDDQQAAIDAANQANDDAFAAEALAIDEAAINLVEGLPADWDGGPGDEPPFMIDTDQDGLTDEAETTLPGLIDRGIEMGLQAYEGALASISLDPRNPVTNGVTPDLEVAEAAVGNLSNATLLVRVTNENFDRVIAPLDAGMAVLEEYQTGKLWEIDVDAVAASSELSGDDAQRAVNLFNGYCARCHTSGWSMGPVFAQPVGGGGFGPSLQPPRARIQFTTQDDLKAFLLIGSESGVGYGVNGIGRGYMPGFGASLTEADLDLIIDYLWGDTLGGPQPEVAE
jgi:mono/diheme cytochrome c family protein